MSQDARDAHRGDILVVDDTVANLRLLVNLLTERGYKVRGVPDGSLALNAARLAPPELILLDINMPGLDGYEVCRQLKDDAHTHHITVIFISALGVSPYLYREYFDVSTVLILG